MTVATLGLAAITTISCPRLEVTSTKELACSRYNLTNRSLLHSEAGNIFSVLFASFEFDDLQSNITTLSKIAEMFCRVADENRKHLQNEQNQPPFKSTETLPGKGEVKDST